MKPYPALFYVGRIFAPIYSILMRLRAVLYEAGIFSQTRLPVPVISIGNLSMGGTGKTPMVLHIAGYFSRTFKTAVVSRGYGGTAKKAVNIVSDGNHILLSAWEAGDEPCLLAESLNGVPVVTGSKRAVCGQFAVDTFGAELIVMDDGFQHLGLIRDCNLVLFAASELMGNGWVFPGGPLREPRTALARADAFILTGRNAENEERCSDFCRMLSKWYPSKPIFSGRYKMVAVRNSTGEIVANPLLKEETVLAFCGIAKPEGFKKSLADAGICANTFLSFSDHQRFTKDERDFIEKQAAQNRCSLLLTTSKDFVKVRDLSFSLPIFIFQMSMDLDDGCIDFVEHCLSRRKEKVLSAS